MKKMLIASLGALVLGCEEPRFEGEIDAYAPACDNRPYVTAGFDSYSIKCGQYYFHHQETNIDGEDRLEYTFSPCFITWADNDCDFLADYWELSCSEYDEEGGLINRNFSYTRSPTEVQQNEYSEALKNIGREDAEQVWVEWNNQ